MFKKLIPVCVGLVLFFAVGAQAAETAIKLVINGKTAVVEPGPKLLNGRVFVPIRFVAERLGAQVDWDGKNRTVSIEYLQGDRYLKGNNNPSGISPGIPSSFTARQLKDLLDDDRDNDLADYRQGHNGGDQKSNDPLVVDVRKQSDYNAKHIPGAVWIAAAENMAESKNVQKLKSLLDEHVSKGGARAIVVYCDNGNSSGLVAGVLGSQGLPVVNMRFGFDIAWQGTQKADSAILAPMEDSSGKTIQCGG